MVATSAAGQAKTATVKPLQPTTGNKKEPPSASATRARKPTTVATAQELATAQRQKREQEEIERKASLAEAEAARQAAEERVLVLERDLQQSREREEAMASTLDCIGQSSLLPGTELPWTADDVRALAADEEAAHARLDELLNRVRSHNSHLFQMIQQQENLAQRLGGASVPSLSMAF